MEDKNIVDKLVEIAKAAHEAEQAQQNLATDELVFCAIPLFAFPKTEIHVHKGIEKLAAEIGAEITVNPDWSSGQSELSFRYNGVKFFQLKHKANE